MPKFAPLIGLAALVALAACGKADTTTNVADASNSAGAALENSAAELESVVDNEVANIDAEANAEGAVTTNASNASR